MTTARRAAEIGALTAQVGLVTSYYSSLNSYTASIASASVTHATSYAQSTADYYVTTADHTADSAEADLAAAITAGASQSEIDTLTATASAKRAKADAFATFATSYVTHLTTQAQTAATTAVANVTSANTTALATIITAVATATTDINTFYDNQIATAANPPPVDTDLDNDGITDPPAPTATQSITASINAAKTANTTARTVVHTAFNSSVIPRTTSSTQTIPTSNAGGGGMSGGGGSNSGGGIPNVTPPITPSGGNGLGSLGPDTSPLQNMIDRMQEQMIDSETGQERGGISNELALGPAGAMGIANGIAAAVEPAAVGFTRGGPGHHWVPFAVFEKFFSDGLISEETRELLNTYLTNPPYDHGFDTWSDGVDLWTHAKYNDSVAEIMTELTKGNKQLNLDKAKALAEFLKTGSEAEWAKLGLDSAAKSRLKGALDAIAGWRKGFFNSIREAQAAILILEEQGIKFTKPEIKAFARRQVNGSVADTGGKLAKEASRITDAINAIKKKGAVGLAKLAEIMKKSTYVAGALIIFAGFLDKTLQAKDVIWGFTGNGKKHIGRDGKEYQHAYLLGAVDTWGYNFIMGQELEGVGAALRDLAPGALPVLVVPADNLQRRMAQGGLTLDMEPGFFTPPKPTAPKPSGGGFWSWWWGR